MSDWRSIFKIPPNLVVLLGLSTCSIAILFFPIERVQARPDSDIILSPTRPLPQEDIDRSRIYASPKISISGEVSIATNIPGYYPFRCENLSVILEDDRNNLFRNIGTATGNIREAGKCKFTVSVDREYIAERAKLSFYIPDNCYKKKIMPMVIPNYSVQLSTRVSSTCKLID